jgi:hypothetical protein
MQSFHRIKVAGTSKCVIRQKILKARLRQKTFK